MSPDSTMKTCCMCGETKPATREFFSPRPKNTDGLEGRCKACNAKRSREARARNPELHKQSQKKYRDEKRDWWIERTRNWRSENPDKVADYTKRYYEQHAPRQRQYSRTWYHANRDRAIAMNKEWRRRNPNSNRIKGNKRRARKLAFPDSFTVNDWHAAVEYFGGCCAVCGRPPGLWHTLAADHWIPISSSDCLGTVPWNIVPLCHGVDGCNNSKKNRDAKEWLVDRFGQRKARIILLRVTTFLEGRKQAEGI